jgi:hypothetical protein
VLQRATAKRSCRSKRNIADIPFFFGEALAPAQARPVKMRANTEVNARTTREFRLVARLQRISPTQPPAALFAEAMWK